MRSRSAILFAMLAALTLFLFLLDLAVGMCKMYLAYILHNHFR